MKRPPIKNPRAYAVVDSDGRVLWGFVDEIRAGAVELAKHPARRLVEVAVVRVVPRKAKRKGAR